MSDSIDVGARIGASGLELTTKFLLFDLDDRLFVLAGCIRSKSSPSCGSGRGSSSPG